MDGVDVPDERRGGIASMTVTPRNPNGRSESTFEYSHVYHLQKDE